jgi:branched-chain amino acid transport system ATP-binding protein
MNASSASISEPDAVLAVEEVWAAYGDRPVLRGVSLTVSPGEVVALIGLNGAGKTTLLRTIMGYLRPQRGRIRLRDVNLVGMAPHDVARRGVGYVPQDQSIFPDLSVDEHLDLGAVTVGGAGARRQRRERAYALFPRLLERLAQKAKTLSGGERQMLSVARALMAKPTVLMLDEPSLGLAPKVVDAIFGLLGEINRDGTAILLVEQNAAKALAASKRAYVLEVGVTAIHAASAELAAREDIQARYLWGEERGSG